MLKNCIVSGGDIDVKFCHNYNEFGLGDIWLHLFLLQEIDFYDVLDIYMKERYMSIEYQKKYKLLFVKLALYN